MDDRSDLYRGFGSGLTRAFELVLIPVIFGGLGWLGDRALGWFPVLTLSAGIFAVVAGFVRLWYLYRAEMDAAQVGAPWRRAGASR